jgi:hypothetical protein
MSLEYASIRERLEGFCICTAAHPWNKRIKRANNMKGTIFFSIHPSSERKGPLDGRRMISTEHET